jgi:hypothetical protein
MWADMVDGARALSGFPAVGAFVALTWSTAGLLAATHAVGLPYASDLGASDVVSGLVLAATPAGAAISALWVSHQHIRRQLMVMFPMAFASTVPLMLTVLKPGLTAVVALWFVGGLLQGYIVTAMAEVVNLTDPERRGRVVGVASAGFSAVAMVTIVGLGGLAELTSPAVTVAIAGVISLCLLIVLYVAWPTAAVSRALRDSYGMAPEPTSR